MAFDSLKKAFASQLHGVGADRISVRTQGCWSCIHGSYEKAADLWWSKARQEILARAAGIATTSPLGENDERVKAVRRNVPLTDVQMEQHQWMSCSVGKKPDGTPVADWVASTYLCDRWTGRDGASIARSGAAPDKLPEELMQRFEDDGTTD